MDLSDKAKRILALLEDSGERLSLKAIGERLPEVPGKAEAVEELLEAGAVWHAGKGRYASLGTLGMELGSLRMRNDGSAVMFSTGEDPVRIEIPAENTAGALDGDTVVARLLEPELNRGGYRGRVVEVISRRRTKMAGIARKNSGKWFLDPLETGLPSGIPMDIGESEDIREGDLVACSIVYGKGRLKVRLAGNVGTPDSPRALIDSVCIDSGLPEDFPEAVKAAAEAAASAPEGLASRRDLTGLQTITIDPADARDFDDAISIERLEDGGFKLGVHIADVSVFVTPGSPLDAEAFSRGTSVYLPDRVIPMIPEVLSNGACSLQPDVERLTKTVMIEYDAGGERKGFTVFSSRIRSRKRMNYAQALEVLEGASSGDPVIEGMFADFGALSALLDKARMKRGAVDLGSSEFRTVFGPDGSPAGFEPVPDDRAHRMIENFMVEANSAVAEYCGWLELDVLYRVHQDPVPEAADKLRRTLSIYGFAVPGHGSPGASALSKAVEEARGTPMYPLVREAVLKSMQRAVYSPSDTGHYGLALRNYAHFTSPIRRYPDLMVHQALTAYEGGRVFAGSVSASSAAVACSDSERRAESAERSATELMALLYLSGRTGETFRGVIRDSVDFGCFVRLLDVPVEGLMHISAIRENPGLVPVDLKPGRAVTVKVEYSDPLERRLSLIPAKEERGEEDE